MATILHRAAGMGDNLIIRDEHGDRRAVLVPVDYVVFVCKLVDGTIMQVPLPARLSRANADRLCAFIQTQVDD